MPKNELFILTLSVILTASSWGFSEATVLNWGYPELELAKTLADPQSPLPNGLVAISYREPTEPLGSPLGETFLLGTTWYDQQHNGTIGKMVSLSPERGVHFCWMNGLQAMAIDRHVYYNYFTPSGEVHWPGVGYQVDYYYRAGYSTLSQLSTGEAVIAYHAAYIQGDPWHTEVAWDFIEGFGAFQITVIDNLPDLDVLIWPKVAVCSQDFIHIVSCEVQPWGGQIWQTIVYARCEDGGYACTPFVVVDTVVSISQDVAASPVSNKVGIAYTKCVFNTTNIEPYEFADIVPQRNNDVILIESQDGVTWDFSAKQNITHLIEPDTSRWPDTTYANGDTLRAYCDVSLLYDQNDNAHVAFTTCGFWFDAGAYADPDSFAVVEITRDASMIWHWSEEHDTLTVVADGWYEVGYPAEWLDWYQGAGAWRSTVDRPSLGLDPATGYLYCIYVRCLPGDTSRAPEPSHGWANGEIYCSVSTDGGLNWSMGTNLTNSPSPNCFWGECMDEDYPSLAQVVNDTLHLFYVEDKDAGSVVQSAPQEGSWTENPVKYQKVPASLVPPGPPYVPNFSFHVGPKEPVPVVLSSFEAAGGPGLIALEWVTASEVACHRWELHRGEQENGNYVKIAELPGHGSSEIAHTYRWIDRKVRPETAYYYKLKQVDLDGSSWWSDSVSATVSSAVPKSYALHQNYPNPFNTSTEIRYQIPEDGRVVLKIFNTLGQEVRTLEDAKHEAGEYEALWDGRDDQGREVASGLYFCRLKAGDFTAVKKMVLVK